MNRKERRAQASAARKKDMTKINGTAVPAAIARDAVLINPVEEKPALPSSFEGGRAPTEAEVSSHRAIISGKSPSRLLILAENRGDAPCRFTLDIFKGPPRDDTLIVTDPQSDPNHLIRLEHHVSTDPGLGIKIEAGNIPWDPPHNERGPMVWFRMPREIRGLFYIHKLEWNGFNMLKQEGIIR